MTFLQRQHCDILLIPHTICFYWFRRYVFVFHVSLNVCYVVTVWTKPLLCVQAYVSFILGIRRNKSLVPNATDTATATESHSYIHKKRQPQLKAQPQKATATASGSHSYSRYILTEEGYSNMFIEYVFLLCKVKIYNFVAHCNNLILREQTADSNIEHGLYY